MPDMPDQRLYDLLARWDQMRAAGQVLAAEELCRECPELLQPLREHIAILRTMTWLEEVNQEPGHDEHNERAVTHLTLPDPAAILARGPDREKEAVPSAIAVPLEALQRAIVDATLLSPAELRSILRQRPGAVPLTSEALAADLYRQEKLTAFQLRLLIEGRGKELALGNYLLLDQIGAGGMGQVFRARHRRMNRVVAIKVLPKNMVDSPQSVDRFHREMRAIARLNHPNIVAAYDADQGGGRHFLVMQYVAGKDLSSLIRASGPLPWNQALACLIQAARGLECAHQQGIVHRDIKPANLIMDAQGIVKLLDLGLARMRRDDRDPSSVSSELTGEGVVMGTVDYMAPEQALDTHAADQRADIYSLGCTLFYLLTGKPPYRGPTLMARMIGHREQAIPSLRQDHAEVPDCLDAIFRRMVAKKPEERFQTVTDLLAELEACAGAADGIGQQPRLAMQAGSWELASVPIAETSSAGMEPTIVKQPALQPNRIITLDRRAGAQPLINRSKRVPLWLPMAVAVVVAVAGLAIVGSRFFRSTPQGDDPSNPAANDTVPKPSPPVRPKAKETAGLAPIPTKSLLDQLDPAQISASEKLPWQPKELVAVIGSHAFRHWGPCHAVVFHPDGKTAVSAGEDKRLRHWDINTLAEQPAIQTERFETYSLALSADGKTLAAGCGFHPAPAVYLWDLSGDIPRLKHTLPNYVRRVTVLAISADGARLAFAGSGETAIELYDLSGPNPKATRLLLDHTKPVTSVAFVGRGSWLLSASVDGTARLWDLAGGEDSEVLQQMKGPCRLAATPDGKRAALMDPGDDSIHIWDFSGNKPRREFVVKTSKEIVAVALSPDGRRLAAASNIHVYAWDLEAGGKQLGQRRDVRATTCLAFDPEGKVLITGDSFGYLRRWKVANSQFQAEAEPQYHYWPLIVPASGYLITQEASGVRDGWDLTGAAPKLARRHASYADNWWQWRFGADGRKLLTFPTTGNYFLIWDWQPAITDPSHKVMLPEGAARVAISGDGRRVLSLHERRVRLWRLENQSLQALAETISDHDAGENYHFWLSHAGDLLAAASPSGVQVWELAGTELKPVPFPKTAPHYFKAFSISRDGKRIAGHFQAMQGVSFWERTAAGFVEKIVVPKIFGEIVASCFSPDGKRLFVAWDWAGVQGYDLTTGALFATWEFQGQTLSLNMSDDGRHLILGNSNGTVYILRQATVAPAAPKS